MVTFSINLYKTETILEEEAVALHHFSDQILCCKLQCNCRQLGLKHVTFCKNTEPIIL
jgi:hypothetical protein